jgi:hypothetical protein
MAGPRRTQQAGKFVNDSRGISSATAQIAGSKSCRAGGAAGMGIDRATDLCGIAMLQLENFSVR